MEEGCQTGTVKQNDAINCIMGHVGSSVSGAGPMQGIQIRISQIQPFFQSISQVFRLVQYVSLQAAYHLTDLKLC